MLESHEAQQPADRGLISISRQDASNYSRILSLLGMEEEGDPVAEVQRLLCVAAQQAAATVPLPAKAEPALIEAICQAGTESQWPDDFGQGAQAIRRRYAANIYTLLIDFLATRRTLA